MAAAGMGRGRPGGRPRSTARRNFRRVHPPGCPLTAAGSSYPSHAVRVQRVGSYRARQQVLARTHGAGLDARNTVPRPERDTDPGARDVRDDDRIKLPPTRYRCPTVGGRLASKAVSRTGRRSIQSTTVCGPRTSRFNAPGGARFSRGDPDFVLLIELPRLSADDGPKGS
jgi:hypothetical protein